jgi:hypothetical protein
MRRLSFLLSALAAAMLVLGSTSANALPPASGSNCSSNWVNNAGAMACFTQGEEDIRNGVAHPHYVACTKAGEVFCCVDQSGGQNCEAVRAGEGGHEHIQAAQLAAILDAQQTTLTLLQQISARLLKLESRLAK